MLYVDGAENPQNKTHGHLMAANRYKLYIYSCLCFTNNSESQVHTSDFNEKITTFPLCAKSYNAASNTLEHGKDEMFF